jgi:hypothetical protein
MKKKGLKKKYNARKKNSSSTPEEKGGRAVGFLCSILRNPLLKKNST